MNPSRQALLMSKPIGITSEASSMLGPKMSINHGTATPTSATLPVLPPAPQPAPRLFWDPPVPLMTAGISHRNALVLSALPRMSLMAGDESRGLCAAMPQNMEQAGTSGRPGQLVYNANVVLTQTPQECSVSGAPGRDVEHLAPLLMTTPPMNTFVNVSATAAAQPQEETWVLRPPPSVPPVVQLVHIRPTVNVLSPPQGAYGERGLTNFQTNLQENLPKPESVYGNFRRWQHIKTLVWRHLSQTPDVEAFSCFLIPVLWSLARWRPTMNAEEGLWKGLQEWQSTSNSDRTIFHEMADKFTEFERSEEMENPRMEIMRGFQCQPPAAPLNQDLPRPLVSRVAEETVCNSMKTGPKVDPAYLQASRYQQSPDTRAPKEILPEVLQKYTGIRHWLEGLPDSAAREPEEKGKGDNVELEQKGDDLYPDPGLLSYVDELCSQENFVEQVEAIINPLFVTEILSPKPEINMLILTQELEREEGLTIDQLLEKRILVLEKELSMWAHTNHCSHQATSSASVLAVCQGADRNDCGPPAGVSAQTCPSQMASSDYQCQEATNLEMLGPKPIVILLESQVSPSLGATLLTAIPCGPGTLPQSPGTRCAAGFIGASPTGGFHEPVGRSNQDEDEVPSPSFFLSSQCQQVTWGLSYSSSSHAGLPNPGAAPQPLSQKRGLSPNRPPAAKSKKRALYGGPAPMAKTPRSGPGPGMSERPPFVLEVTCHSQPQKRKCGSLGTRRRKRKKRH